MTSVNNFWSGFVGAMLGALITSLVNIHNSKKQLLNSLDDKLDWRKRLYDVACKKDLDLNDIYTIRTALRIFPKKYGSFDLNSFDSMTYEIITFCDLIENDYESTNHFTSKQRNLIHLYTRYLLKHHWEVNQQRIFKSNELYEESKIIHRMRMSEEYQEFWLSHGYRTDQFKFEARH